MPEGTVLQRYDDRLATMLRTGASPRERAALWRQLTLYLAGSAGRVAIEDAARALAALASIMRYVPIEARVASAHAIAARCGHAPLAVLLSHDVPAVVVPLFDGLRMADDDWEVVLPQLSPLARSRLRARRDLPGSVHRALASLAAADFALPGAAIVDTPNPVPAATGVGSPIADLVHRIEAYRNRKPSNDTAPPAVQAAASFVADADGLVRIVEAGPRAAFVGISLADVAPPGRPGVDAGTATAFARRDRIAGGRLLTAVGTLFAIEAEPIFAAVDGRFAGYRGTMSQDLGGIVDGADAVVGNVEGSDQGLAAAMAQMAHELRSPLNAISGFAQLIAGQYFGPVASGYRSIAAAIVTDAAALTEAFEGIDLAARIDTGRFARGEGSTLLSELLPDCADGETRVAVARADAARLLQLLRQPGGADRAPPAEVSVEAGAVILEFARGESEDDSIAIAIAERLAPLIGCSIVRSSRKTIVNMPRLGAEAARADAHP